MIHILQPDREIYCPSCGANYVRWIPTSTAGTLRCRCRRCQDEFVAKNIDGVYKII